MVAVAGAFQEIRFSRRVVEGLIAMNESNRRGDASKDKSFIKAVLIATCTLKTIYSLNENQRLPKGVLSFVKGERIA